MTYYRQPVRHFLGGRVPPVPRGTYAPESDAFLRMVTSEIVNVTDLLHNADNKLFMESFSNRSDVCFCECY